MPHNRRSGVHVIWPTLRSGVHEIGPTLRSGIHILLFVSLLQVFSYGRGRVILEGRVFHHLLEYGDVRQPEICKT